MASSVVAILMSGLFGALSYKIGRWLIFICGSAFVAVCAFPFFFLLQTGSSWLMLSGHIRLFNIAQVLLRPAQPACETEMLGLRMRYTGTSMGSQLSAILAGGLLPFIAKASTPRDITPSWYPVAACLVVTSLISAIVAYVGLQTSRRIITKDPPRQPRRRMQCRKVSNQQPPNGKSSSLAPSPAAAIP